MSSPPRIQRDHGDMPDDMVLFPTGDDSSDYMSPELTRPPVHHQQQQQQQEEEADRGSPVEFPADESHADTSSRITKGKVAASSVAETKTTAQMTNLTERSEHPRTEDAWDFEMELMTKSRVFRSVLSQPIPVWNDMEEAVLQYAPQWKPAQRSKLIELWVKFMELKVIVEDYSGNEEDLLLAPTQLIGRVWYSITQNSHLYQEVLYWIQDYHDKDRCLIYRPPLTLSPSNFNDSHSQEEGDSSSGGGGGGPNSSSGHAAKDDDTAIAHFQEGSHHRLERAQRLFICYFQQAMPESLKAVNNMSKRRSSETIQENNIVAENASDAGDSDFSGNDDDCDDDNDDDDDMELDNKSVHTEASENWITKFQSWLSCWEDPFGSNASTSATAEPKKKARSQNELLREQEGNDASFWPCATTNNAKDDVEIIRRSNNIGQPNAGSADDPLPALNETDEQSSTLWVTFDSKQDTTVEDDELTFLTMDTALDKGSPEKRGKKKAKFYSPPRRFQAGHQQATITTPPTPQTPQSPKKPPPSSYAAQYSSPRKTKNKLPSVAAQQRKAPPQSSAAAAGAATPPPKAATKAQAKQQREQEKKEMNWKALKAKFRIASMILKEFE